MSKTVIVASKNPVKKDSVRIGFEKMYPEIVFEFEGVSVASGVNDQPTSDLETLRGAMNRCENAFEQFQDADYWVGIEGGIETRRSETCAYAWIVIKSKEKHGKARTGTFFLPQKIVDLLNIGKELGEADDLLFGRSNSKQESGAVGLLTDNVIDRTSLYAEAVMLALIPFRNPDLY